MIFLSRYLALLESAENQLSKAFLSVARRHNRESGVWQGATLLARWSAGHVARLKTLRKRYGHGMDSGARRIDRALFSGPRRGGIGVLRDLHDLSTLAHFVHTGWSASLQGARMLRDRELEMAIREMGEETDRQIAWLRTMIQEIAAQALAVPPDLVSELIASRPRNLSSAPRRTIRKAALLRLAAMIFPERQGRQTHSASARLPPSGRAQDKAGPL